jgi:biotin carboxyl carrier protein
MSLHLFVLRGAGQTEDISAARRESGWIVTRGGDSLRVEVQALPDGRLSLLAEDGRQFCGRVRLRGNGEVEVVTSRGGYLLPMADRLRDRLAHSAGDAAGGAREEEIRAQIPGRVVEVSVKEGDRVAAGALLLVLEAMKMQNEIRASRAGIVDRVAVCAGQTVEGEALMLSVRSGT